MPTKTMDQFEPTYGYRKNVFVINDIDLVVPPTNIDIQIEDLVWQWRALRQRATTKVPSGHGQVAVSITIPFTGPMVLDMHRLVVEFRHSPFCYVENRFLRETIVPHWPYSQAMAFTMTGLNVAPMQGSSDTWIMQLDLTWFNYFPYVHNWLYRKDWHTLPVTGETSHTKGSGIETTIGWDAKAGQKKQKHTILPKLGNSDNEIRSWSAVQGQYQDRQELTIEQMEEFHQGEIFDLLPLPDKMAQSEFVQRPAQSRIYTRYINLLQRDALMKAFSIDVEKEILTSTLWGALFSAVLYRNDRHTFGLHSGPPASTEELYREWKLLRNGIVAKMNSVHGGALFHFFAYKEVRLPAEWTGMISDAHKETLRVAKDKLPSAGGTEVDGWELRFDPTDTFHVDRVKVRRRFSSALGKDGSPRVSPVGYSNEDVPMPVDEVRVTDTVHWRSAATRSRLAGRPTGGSMHWGTDIGAGDRDRNKPDVLVPIYAVEAGTVSHIQLTDSSSGGSWKLAYLNDTELTSLPFDQEDFEVSIKAIVPEVNFRGANVTREFGETFPVGSFVKSIKYRNAWYYVEAPSAGNYIQMSHGNNLSMYMHLGGVSEAAMNSLNATEEIPAGTLIGWMSGSGPMNEAFKANAIVEARKEYLTSGSNGYQYISRTSNQNFWDNPSGERSSVWHYQTHLHFEYWESEDLGVGIDPPWTGTPALKEDWKRSSRMVPVDLSGPLETSVAGSYELTASPSFTTPTQTTVKEDIAEEAKEGNISNEELQSVGQILDNLWRDGWLYYDRDSKITNVWWKHHKLLVGPGNEEQLEKGFYSDPTVLTAVAGGLRHIVANIPILGYEFPTQQHLGSIEPFYSFEFCSVDFEGSGTQRLAGVSKQTEVLLAMRGLLHANARNFRGITDSWCVAVDSFVTRLLGTFSPDDIQIATYNNVTEAGEEPVIADIEVLRRAMVTRSNSMTVQGHPGMSCHTIELSETNPYVGEAINGTAPAVEDLEVAYSKVLNAVYKLAFKDEAAELLQQVLIAQLAGANTYRQESDEFGQFELSYVTSPLLVEDDNVALYRDKSDNDWIIFGDDFSSLANGPDSIGNIVGAGTSLPESSIFSNLNAVPLDQVFGGVPQSGGAGGHQGDAWRAAYAQVAKEGRPVAAPTASSVPDENITPKEFDISALLQASQDTQVLGKVPMEKILDYWTMIHKTIQTASAILAESDDQLAYGTVQAGGNTIDFVQDELYELPVQPNLFKGYQLYLATVAAVNPYPGPSSSNQTKPLEESLATGAVVEHLVENQNWLQWHPQNGLTSVDLKKLQTGFGAGYAGGLVGWGALGTIVERPVSFIWATVVNGGDKALKTKFGQWNDSDRGIYADFWAEMHDDVLTDIANNYMWQLPVRDLVEERFKSYVSSTIFGDILGTVAGEGGSPVFASTTEQLKKTAASCGDFQFDRFFDMPKYVMTERGTTSDNIREASKENQDIGIAQPSDIPKGQIAVPILLPDGASWDWFFFNKQEGIWPPGGPFIWHAEASLESKKIEYFKSLFARYACDLLNDYDVLKAFGLQGLSRVNKRARIQGSPALPDMDLPHHPYYGDIAACPPDFYMWNMYEDGDAHNRTVITAIQDVMGDIVSNCYNSMKKIESGGSYEPSGDRYVQEPATDDRISLPQYYNAEATDTGKKGATGFPFYPNPESTEAISEHIGNITNAVDALQSEAEEARMGTEKDSTKPELSISIEEAKALSSVHVEDVRLSNFEGAFGQGGGVQYPRRVTAAQYNELQDAVASVDQMFGSRSGYLDQKEIPENLADRLRGTLVERESDPSHRFNKESLNKLALNSANDIFGRKRRMSRAYPTFKLFFVEEDEFESRLLNFDDFFSYNGVTSFTVEQNRKSPADHAVVSLLNVAGTLDGTKRDAVVDLDYFSDSSKINIPGEASKLSGDSVNEGSALDQPFGALVLRPGLNVQLRVGYSNDPDLLEVLINGRVVDVTWNQGGDRAEILVQSFGTELQQAIKGTSAANDSRAFATTHQLLGAMMLEPELQHFGRWEFGQLYQVGEGQDARLDFVDYSRKGFLGAFKATNRVTDWMLNNPIITATLAIGGAAVLGRIPGVGRLLRPAAGLARTGAVATRGVKNFSWVSKWLGTLGVNGPGTAFYRSALTNIVGKRIGVATTVANKVVQADIRAVSRLVKNQQALRGMALRDAGGTAGRALVRESQRIQANAIRRAAVGSIDDAARALAKADAEIANLVLKGQWMSHPMQQIAGQSVGLLRSVGIKPISRVWGGIWYRAPLLVGGVSISALPLAGLDWAFSELYDASVGRIKAYFRQKQVSLFLSPQDDNLFPPHPKDYMEIYDKSWTKVWEDMKMWVVKTGVSAFVTDDELGYQAARWFGNKPALDKRVAPASCSFRLISTTIWDVFHEMSLRHPGWIYAARPYGHAFRYTMFFGVPSQRYWSQPGDNEFVRRANDLNEVLGNSSVDMNEYRRLYGDVVDDGYTSLLLEDFDANLDEEAIVAASVDRNSANDMVTNTVYVNDPATQQSVPVEITTGTVYETDPVDVDKIKSSLSQLTYTPRAMKEYLRALNLRFKPFRRYHSVTSEHDIVWNGLMSSENAVHNAVDVTYFEENAKFGDSPASSAMFKAHAFIPEHDLRVLPLQPSYNVRGYQMAMRYGVGSLLHTMREMYRGEIVILGNPRIRPWDVGILSDSYNDMVGPFEVEQIVHQFSHETGFISEIKPSAMVIANETSSWPVLEAIKVAALAVRDVEDQYEGLGATDPGARFRFLDWVLGFGAGNDSSSLQGALDLGTPHAATEYRKYLEERAAELRPFDPFANPKTGKSDLEEIREIEDELGSVKRGLTQFTGGALGVATGALALKGIPWVFGAAGKTVPKFLRMQSGTAMGVMGILGAGGAVFAGNRLTPSLTWLLGSPILFLQALRGDSIMLVPLMKNGNPIVSGVNLTDPSMIWNNFKGDLGRWVEDTLDGTRDLTDIWRLYGKHAWRRNEHLKRTFDANSDVWNQNKQLYAELTGES